jgi:hypothetical protein
VSQQFRTNDEHDEDAVFHFICVRLKLIRQPLIGISGGGAIAM